MRAGTISAVSQLRTGANPIRGVSVGVLGWAIGKLGLMPHGGAAAEAMEKQGLKKSICKAM